MKIDQTMRIIGLLADGKFHSGESLGEILGVTRSAVWKSLKKLTDLGIDIHRVQGKGYAIPNGIEVLETDKITSSMTPELQSLINSIDILPTVNSTNAFLLDKIKQGKTGPMVCLAEHQTQGRGRQGRKWVSPFGKNIYLSLSWSFPEGPIALAGLTIVAGVAVTRALQKLGLSNLGIKWPNDIYWAGRKLAGILTEVHLDSVGVCHAVIGVGINVEMSQNSSQEIDQPWADIYQALGHSVQRNQLVGTIISELLMILADYEQQGFAAYHTQWQAYDLLHSRQVILNTLTGVEKGTACGIDENGGLLVKQGDTVNTYRSGEVHLEPTH
tara:strand:- start:6021 stop:7004 length:984 start_codon:yes stop_codon:yes gene_type:complete